jgi:hypothetical protein
VCRIQFICQCFGTLCLFHLHRRVVMKNSSYLPAYEDGTDSVPKHWHIKFRRRGITRKKAYNNIWVTVSIHSDRWMSSTGLPVEVLTTIFFDSRLPQCDIKSCNVALFHIWFRAVIFELVVSIYARFFSHCTSVVRCLWWSCNLFIKIACVNILLRWFRFSLIIDCTRYERKWYSFV